VDDEFLGPDIEVVAVERAGRDAAGHRRGAAAAHIGFVDERDGRLQVRGTQCCPAAGKATADNEHIGLQDIHPSKSLTLLSG
jgi:hypothetical protein